MLILFVDCNIAFLTHFVQSCPVEIKENYYKVDWYRESCYFVRRELWRWSLYFRVLFDEIRVEKQRKHTISNFDGSYRIVGKAFSFQKIYHTTIEALFSWEYTCLSVASVCVIKSQNLLVHIFVINCCANETVYCWSLRRSEKFDILFTADEISGCRLKK